MKKAFSAKNVFLKIFCICAATLFPACDLFQESPKDFLEDYASIATVATYQFSREAISQGAQQNIDSSADFTITYFVDNPGNHRLRAAIEFQNGLALSKDDFSFPENAGLLQSWIEETTDEDGNPARVTRTESETNFLKSTFSITIPQATLANIDGDTSTFNISPTVTLYRADFGEEQRKQSVHKISLRCNNPPAPISAAIGQMIETDDVQTLVLAIKLPALKVDDKYLTVSENGWTHVFERAAGAADFNRATSSDGWTISSDAPENMEPTYDGGDSAPDGANCFITTDINIKGLAPFGITLTLTDEGGLFSSLPFTSHGQKCLPPTSSSTSPLAQSESDGMATYVLNAEPGATIHYTVTTAGGAKVSEGSGASPLSVKLPAGTFNISARATKPGFVDSDGFTANNINVTPRVFFVSASGNDTSGDGSKSKPFATIAHAADSLKSLVPPPVNSGNTTIFLLSDLEITDNKTIILSPTADTSLNLRGCKGGSAGSRATVSFKFSNSNISSAFAIEGTVQMQDLTIRQTQDSSAINGDGIVIRPGNTLSLKNVSITEMKTGLGAVNLEGESLNILGGVKITGNTNASGGALNLFLPTDPDDGKTKTISVQIGSLEGTQIGVSTAADPASAPVKITSGYSGAGYRSSQLNSYFTSDKGFGLKIDDGEAALSASGGSIGIVPPKEIKFSFDSADSNKNEDSGDGSAITISAVSVVDGDETPLNIADFTTFVGAIYLGSVPTEHRIDFKESNPFNFDPSWNLDSEDYVVIEVTAIYGGTEFSGTLHYNYKKTP